MSALPPASTLFPYTTLFRSNSVPGGLICNAAWRQRQMSVHSSPRSDSAPRKPLTLHALRGMQQRGEPIAMLTAYDASFAVLRSEEHTSELQSQFHLVCRLLL